MNEPADPTTSERPETFISRLHAAVEQKGSCLVVGLDPVLENLPSAVIGSAVRGVSGQAGETARASVAIGLFLSEVIEAVREEAVAVKPNSAFFERWGAAGWEVLVETCRHARAAGLLVILDAKRGDIGHTAEAYAGGLFGDQPDTPGPDVDAVTLNPYLGSDSMTPWLERVRTAGKGIYALVRTSNPSAAEIQELDCGGRPVYLHVAERVARWAEEAASEDGWSSVGAVVGATSPECAAEIRRALPRSSFLVPGVGAQGGRPEDLRSYFGEELGAVVNASRGVVGAFAGKSGDWREHVRGAAAKLRDELEAVRRG